VQSKKFQGAEINGQEKKNSPGALNKNKSEAQNITGLGQGAESNYHAN
jgi:hypothetical protein